MCSILLTSRKLFESWQRPNTTQESSDTESDCRVLNFSVEETGLPQYARIRQGSLGESSYNIWSHCFVISNWWNHWRVCFQVLIDTTYIRDLKWKAHCRHVRDLYGYSYEFIENMCGVEISQFWCDPDILTHRVTYSSEDHLWQPDQRCHNYRILNIVHLSILTSASVVMIITDNGVLVYLSSCVLSAVLQIHKEVKSTCYLPISFDSNFYSTLKKYKYLSDLLESFDDSDHWLFLSQYLS